MFKGRETERNMTFNLWEQPLITLPHRSVFRSVRLSICLSVAVTQKLYFESGSYFDKIGSTHGLVSLTDDSDLDLDGSLTTSENQ